MGKYQDRYNICELANDLEVNVEGVANLFSGFIEEMKTDISRMKGFCEKKDWNSLERIVHNIKGVSANLNISDVYAEATEFDELLKKNIVENIEVRIEILEALMQNAETDIRGFFAENNIKI